MSDRPEIDIDEDDLISPVDFGLLVEVLEGGYDLTPLEAALYEQYLASLSEEERTGDTAPPAPRVGTNLAGRFDALHARIAEWRTRGEPLAESVVGMGLDEATAVVEGEGFVVREASVRLGVTALPADHQSDRITLFGDADDRVVRAQYG